MQVKTKRWVYRLVLGAAALAILGTGMTVYLLRRPPAVWHAAQDILTQTTPQERAEIADRVRDRLSSLVDGGDSTHVVPEHSGQTDSVLPGLDESGVAPSDQAVDETHELKLTNEELVAVVEGMFADWTAQRGFEVPTQIDQPVVLADSGRLAIAFAISTPSWQQVFSGFVDLTFMPDGMARGRVKELTAGSLPVSVVSLTETLRKQLPKSEAALADQIGQWVAQLEDFEFRPVLELEHRRRARVVAMTVGDDAVTLTMRVQDHATYKTHNALMDAGSVAVTDVLDLGPIDGGLTGIDVFADVPTTTD